MSDFPVDDDFLDEMPPEGDYVPPADDEEMLIGGEYNNGGPFATGSYLTKGHEVRTRQSPRDGQRRREEAHQQRPGRSAHSPAEGFGSHDVGAQPRQRMVHVRRSRAVHFSEMALQASISHGGSAISALPSQQKSVLYCIASSLAGAGCARSLLHLQRVLPRALAPQEVNPRAAADLMFVAGARAAQVGRSWEDESVWPVDALLQKTAEFVTVDERNKAQGTTAESLVERLVAIETDPPSLSGKPHINYTNIFLFTFHFFIPLSYFFAITARMMVTCQSEAGHTISDARALHLQRRIVSLWAWVLAIRWPDVTRDVAARLEAFTASFPLRFTLPTEVQKGLMNLSTLCASQLSGSGGLPCSRRVTVHSSLPRPPPNMPVDASPRSLLDIEDVELARQLCVLSFSLFSRIRLRELEHSGWTHDHLQYTTGDLLAFVTYAERTTRWIAGAIAGSADPDVRRLLYRKVVRVARYLYDLQNYAMLTALYQAIDHNAVTRLDASRAALPKDEEEALDAIRSVMDPFSSVLKDIPHTIASPAIPLMAPFLSVASRLEEGYKTFVVGANGAAGVHLVNWSKMAELGSTLIKFASFQAIPFPYIPIPNVQRFLWVMPGALSEDGIMAASKAHEQR